MPRPPVTFRQSFVRLFLVRLTGTVALRFTYPFLPTIADGVDASLGAIGVAVAIGEGSGLLAPFIGRRLDRIGRRRGMVQGLVLTSLGCAVAAASPTAIVFGIGLATIMLGRMHYDVSFGAWVGDEVPFAKRGRASGVSELSWSGAFLVGVPIAGLVAAATTWRVPFAVSAVLMLAAVPVVRATLPALRREHHHEDTSAVPHARVTPLHLAIAAISLGAAAVLVVEGAWFDTDLGLGDEEISAVVVLLGLGEVAGTLLAATLTDRIGKKPAVVGGAAILVPAVAAMSWVGSSAVAGVALAFAVGLGFELAFVAALPLVVEVSPERRAAALGLAMAALTLARTVAAVSSTALFDAEGIDAVVLLSVPTLAVGLVVVGVFVREPGRSEAGGSPRREAAAGRLGP